MRRFRLSAPLKTVYATIRHAARSGVVDSSNEALIGAIEAVVMESTSSCRPCVIAASAACSAAPTPEVAAKVVGWIVKAMQSSGKVHGLALYRGI